MHRLCPVHYAWWIFPPDLGFLSFQEIVYKKNMVLVEIFWSFEDAHMRDFAMKSEV